MCPTDRRHRDRPAHPAGRFGDAGSVSVEGVIIAPIVLLATLLVLQAGFYYMANVTAGNAAQLAVERARSEGSSDSAGQAAAQEYLARAGESGAQVDVSRTATEVTASVTTESPALIPGGLLPDVTVHAVAPVERVTQ